jgi:hypothetical protein
LIAAVDVAAVWLNFGLRYLHRSQEYLVEGSGHTLMGYIGLYDSKKRDQWGQSSNLIYQLLHNHEHLAD